MNKHLKMDAVGLGFILALTATAYFGEVSPTIQSRDLARAQAAELASQQTKSRDLERNVHLTTDKLTASKAALAANSLQLKPADELNQRLAQLTDLAGNSGLQVDAIESGEKTDYERYSTISIHLSGRGTYRKCQAALTALHKTMPDVGVVSFQINSGGLTPDTTAIFVFDLLWHTQPPVRATKK